MLPLKASGAVALLGSVLLSAAVVAAAGQDPARPQKPPVPSGDPFAGLEAGQPDHPEDQASELSWLEKFTRENFLFKMEIYSQFTGGYRVEQDPPFYSRQSLGFEVLKKFSTATSTVAAFNAQFRVVRRDNYIMVPNDMEGAGRTGFIPEYHNIYLDLYNVFNPFMSDAGRSRHLGRYNWRTGRFYLPFGINLQTDTHGTLLQLSNDRDFGFERDWYTGFYGSVNRNVNYDIYYLLGSGYYPRFRGQSGMLGARISLGNRLFNEKGLEGGVSFMAGERISQQAVKRSPSVAAASGSGNVVRTLRFGVDGRYTRPLWNGTMVFTTEIFGGEDKPDALFGDLHQFEYLSRSRQWGWAAQYRRFWQDIDRSRSAAPLTSSEKADSSIIGEFSLYFRNDPSASRLHWLKFNAERQLERQEGDCAWLFTVQYYYYW